MEKCVWVWHGDEWYFKVPHIKERMRTNNKSFAKKCKCCPWCGKTIKIIEPENDTGFKLNAQSFENK